MSTSEEGRLLFERVRLLFKERHPEEPLRLVRELGHRLAFVGGDSDSLLIAPVKIPLEDGLFILLSGRASPGVQREVEAFIAGERESKG